ncbi:hypothetical protein EJ08DRAFT_389131 [Tothia fuscella]|uniref:Uncharacterized protein n=1 Tax=Tothia fuscella TaxID=1048955 RepID=A0A9P4NZ22_9PEZI|nr:hypothetical protein EJ08DRAFT_389131 [Tothia fuscella]
MEGYPSFELINIAKLPKMQSRVELFADYDPYRVSSAPVLGLCPDVNHLASSIYSYDGSEPDSEPNSACSASSNGGTETATQAAKKLAYIDVHPRLPLSAPFGYPHILNCNEIVQGVVLEMESIHLADAVATTLYNYKPSALEKFLNLPNDKIAYYIWDSGSDDCMSIIMARKGDKILVATYEPLADITGDNSIVWDCMTVHSLQHHGMWTPSHAYDDGKVSRDIFATPNSFFLRPAKRINNIGTVHDFAAMLAEYILNNKCWEVAEGSGANIRFVISGKSEEAPF